MIEWLLVAVVLVVVGFVAVRFWYSLGSREGYHKGYRDGYRDGYAVNNPDRLQYNYPDKEEGD